MNIELLLTDILDELSKDDSHLEAIDELLELLNLELFLESPV
jgi:hypothetical protein